MSHLRHVDLVISLVCADPFDPDDGLLEIDRHYEAIVIALDVEDNPLRADDAYCRIAPFHIRGAPRCRFADFVEPGIQCGLHRRLVLLAGEAFDEFTQGTTGDDPHPPNLSRSQYGSKSLVSTAATRTAQAIPNDSNLRRSVMVPPRGTAHARPAYRP